MPTLIVRSAPKLRFRAGCRFTRTPDVYDVSEEQEKAIRSDPKLVVEEPKAAEPEKALPATPAPAPDEKGTKRRAER
jgi:hypothetical protein